MTDRAAIALAQQLEAARILEAHGWRKVSCGECKGTGFSDSHPLHSFAEEAGKVRRVCPNCEGAKFTWEKL